MKPFFVYMLQCRDGSYYVGHTDELEMRIARHQDGTFGGHTARRRPVALVWSVETSTRAEALETELQLKRWTRAKKDALVRGDWAAIVRLSGPRTGPDLRRPFVLRQAQHERTLGSAATDVASTASDETRQGVQHAVRPDPSTGSGEGRTVSLAATEADDA